MCGSICMIQCLLRFSEVFEKCFLAPLPYKSQSDTFHIVVFPLQGDIGPRGFSWSEGPSGALGDNGKRGVKGEKGYVGLRVSD